MAKINMICPFSKRLCQECAIYRGRHYYLCFCEEYRGYIDQPEENTKAEIKQPVAERLSLHDLMKPTNHRYPEDYQLKLKLRVIDVDDGSTEVCDIGEAKTWDYNSQITMITVAGRQITSWDHLTDVLSSKTYDGRLEVEVHKLPLL